MMVQMGYPDICIYRLPPCFHVLLCWCFWKAHKKKKENEKKTYISTYTPLFYFEI